MEISTNDLEEYIDLRYEVGAPQNELNKLEDIYAERVVEYEINMTEEEISISEETHEGAGLEEQLINMYHRYITPDIRQGMKKVDILNNMRSAIETYGGKKNITNIQILFAAKDTYKYKKTLIEKYRSKNKISNTPAKFQKILQRLE